MLSLILFHPRFLRLFLSIWRTILRIIDPGEPTLESVIAVYEGLQQLTHLVWERYQFQIIDLLDPSDAYPQCSLTPQPQPTQTDLFDLGFESFSDEPPF